jgi:hypothetical protein
MIRQSGAVRPRTVDRLPFWCVLAAIALLACAAISWVISPTWGRHNTLAAARDVGRVPTAPGALAALVTPQQIVIPKLHVKAPIVAIGTTAGRELAVPTDPRVVGWWRHGAAPGARHGTAVLAGHINYAGVEGSLARIGTLDPGDVVYVRGLHKGKRTTVRFKITGVRTYQKTALPYRQIFDQSTVGRLAIVTCGGPFDASTGNYLDNIVAYAVPG